MYNKYVINRISSLHRVCELTLAFENMPRRFDRCLAHIAVDEGSILAQSCDRTPENGRSVQSNCTNVAREVSG